MRGAWVLVLSLACFGSGCAILMPVGAVVSAPFDKKQTFEEIQRRYTSDLRYGLFDRAIEVVEPELRPQFRKLARALDELRITSIEVDSLQLDSRKAHATVEMRYRGYWLASPFEREVLVTQHWRRDVPTNDWYVTPEIEEVLEAARRLGPVSASPR
jgi:hypothetical protein